jgi:hypothetical protein
VPAGGAKDGSSSVFRSTRLSSFCHITACCGDSEDWAGPYVRLPHQVANDRSPDATGGLSVIWSSLLPRFFKI